MTMTDRVRILRGRMRAELDKMHGMTWREKLGYIRDYYISAILILFLIAAAVAAVVQGIQNRGEEDFMNMAVLEYTGVYSGLEEAGNRYLETLQAQNEDVPADTQAVVYDYSGITLSGLQTGHSYQEFQSLSAQMSVGDVDIVFMTEDMILFLQKRRDSYFISLDELYSEEKLARLGDQVYKIADENGEEYPAAVDVSRWGTLKDAVTEEEPLYAAVVIGGRHAERASDFLYMMMCEENCR